MAIPGDLSSVTNPKVRGVSPHGATAGPLQLGVNSHLMYIWFGCAISPSMTAFINKEHGVISVLSSDLSQSESYFCCQVCANIPGIGLESIRSQTREGETSRRQASDLNDI